MNRLTVIGNLTADPALRTVNTANGPVSVCDFTVAVNRRQKGANEQTDFFRVSAWRGLGENCAKYLAKGRKVAVTGPVSARAYNPQNGGDPRAVLEVTAEDVEFLGGKEAPETIDIGHGITATVVDDEAPF